MSEDALERIGTRFSTSAPAYPAMLARESRRRCKGRRATQIRHPTYSPISEDNEPGKPASKRSSEYSPVTPAASDDDEQPELKRLKQHENDTTVTNSESFSPLTPVRNVKTEATTDDLILAGFAFKLTT